MGLGVGRGLVGLFKKWGKDIGNAADHVWLREEARKAIRDEVTNKFKPKIDLANTAESRRATNIKDLDAKLTQSKKDLVNAQKTWKDKYDAELAAAQNKRQIDIADYNAKLQGYKDALDKANAGKKSIFNKLYDDEDNYDRFHTIFTDVNTGERFILNKLTGQPESLTKAYKHATPKEIQNLTKIIQDYDNRLYDFKLGKAVNAFDDSDINAYSSNSKWFREYYRNKISTQNSAIRNADDEIKQADDALNSWKNNNSLPKNWGKNDSKRFEQDFKSNNGESPTEYSFNGQKYSDVQGLEAAYQKALNHAQNRRDYFRTKASDYASERDAEIAQRIQDAKDMNKAKVLLGGTLGAGALYAAGKAMYGSDDTDNTDSTGNINNIDNTDYGNPDPAFKAENTPEGKAGLNGESIDTGFDPDKADALAAAAYEKGVEDSNSIESSDDLGNNIAAKTGGHTIDDRLFELLKAMEDPYKADAIANYIYSRHGDDPEVQRLGWRGWLNKYYGDSLRSRMNIDPSGYKGMHISGGL